MKKGYIPMMKYWIEDHYEQDEVIDFKVYTSVEDAIKYLENFSLQELKDDDNISMHTNKDGIDYIVIYDKYLSERYDDLNNLWGDTGAGWYYAKEIEIVD